MAVKVKNDIWKQIEEQLQPYSSVELLVDEHEITLQLHLERINMKYHIAVFVDGEMNWNEENKELREKFWCAGIKAFYKPSEVKELEKECGKRWLKKNHPEAYKKGTFYRPHFRTFGSLRNQWKKRGLKPEIRNEVPDVVTE